jgi:two-component system cell cycle sensor histidine kinase/response regulator CckA
LEIENRSTSGSSPPAMPRDHVALRTSDNGGGIEPAHLDRIFDPFFPVKDRSLGTGLGLATCHAIVTQAGGSIAAESELGKGTTFTILLPRACNVAAKEPAGVKATSTYDGPETILIVEDDAAVMRATASILQAHGYAVMTAANGEEACRILQRESEKIDLVLSDMVMPRLSGPELEKIVTAKWPQLPLIFMTGYSEQPAVQLEDGMRIENRPALMKPFRAHALLQVVRETLDHRGKTARIAETPSTAE